MSEQTKKTLPHFSDFTEEEFQHLLFASYFSRVNRYNLEFLCSPRDAAFSYNWLKRQKSIAKQEPDGSLIINQEVRDQIQEFHRQDNPEEAERLNVIATIVDAFIAIFPESETHWIPIHLQARLFHSGFVPQIVFGGRSISKFFHSSTATKTKSLFQASR